jgi:hypothetical protein
MPRTSSSRRQNVSQHKRRAQELEAAQSVIDARSQKAWRAVRQFTAMIPTFTSFARMATGNNQVRVQLGKQGAQTDGNTIWIFPPISLGEERVHQRHLCDRRGPDKRQQCKACDAREVVLFYLYHEIAHIAFDSATSPLQYLVDRVVDMIEEWHPSAACGHAGTMIRSANNARQYLDLVAAHNAYLPILTNALEDARVNARMFRARPGLKILFEAGTVRIFENGIELSSGVHQMWSEQPLNSQIIIGLFLAASGYGIPDGYLSQPAVDALGDDELMKLIRRVTVVNSVHQIVEISLDAFRRLNELGFCSVPKCEVQPPMPAPPSEDDDEEKDGNKSTDGSSSNGGSSQTGDADEADTDDDQPGEPSDGSSSPDRGNTGDTEDQHDAGDSEDADPSSSDPDESEASDGDADEGDDERASGTGDRESQSGEEPGADADEDSSSLDDGLGGSDDDDDSPEGEDGPGAGSSASGAGSADDRDEEDSPEVGPSSGASASDDEDDSTSSGDGGDQGESDPGMASPEDGDDPDDDETDDDWSDEDESEDVSESVWDDPTNSEAAADQQGSPGGGSFPDYGSPAEVADVVKIFGAHADKDEDDDSAGPGHNHSHFGDEEDGHVHTDPIREEAEEALEALAVDLAIRQGNHFDTQRTGVGELIVVEHPHYPSGWVTSQFIKPESFYPTESIMGRAVMQGRLAFEANQRSAEVRNLKSGRLDRRAVGKRAPVGDSRMFQKKRRPENKSYFFAIGVDISGSTRSYGRNPRILRSVFAQAMLLERLGHSFAIYGMTGGRNLDDLHDPNYYLTNDVWIFKVKGPDEPWSKGVQQRLADLKPCNENFDGHNFEFLRKVLDSRRETSRAIIYYTDGAMPARNAEEELAILTNELLICKKRGYGALAVGINTDSPREYGLDTVQVDSDDDVVNVTRQLGIHLSRS